MFQQTEPRPPSGGHIESLYVELIVSVCFITDGYPVFPARIWDFSPLHVKAADFQMKFCFVMHLILVFGLYFLFSVDQFLKEQICILGKTLTVF